MDHLPPQTFYKPSTQSHLLDSMAQIHHDCVISDGTVANLLDVSDRSKLLKYWRQQHDEVIAGTRLIFLQLTGDREDELAGVVMLHMPESESKPSVSFVQKLMISPRHRRKGIARGLMEFLEEEARQRDRGLIMINTIVGSGADEVYPRMGYKRT